MALPGRFSFMWNGFICGGKNIAPSRSKVLEYNSLSPTYQTEDGILSKEAFTCDMYFCVKIMSSFEPKQKKER